MQLTGSHITGLFITLLLTVLSVTVLPAQASDNLTIRDGVLLLEDGKPASFAMIEFYAPDGSVHMEVADRNGHFDFSLLAPNKYIMIVSTPTADFAYMGVLTIPDSYEPATFEGMPQNPDMVVTTTDSLNALEVAAPLMVVEPLLITVAEPATITGQVNPAQAGTAVIIRYEEVVIGYAETEADGSFSIENLAPGSYSITGYGDKWMTDTELISLVGGETLELNLTK